MIILSRNVFDIRVNNQSIDLYAMECLKNTKRSLRPIQLTNFHRRENIFRKMFLREKQKNDFTQVQSKVWRFEAT